MKQLSFLLGLTQNCPSKAQRRRQYFSTARRCNAAGAVLRKSYLSLLFMFCIPIAHAEKTDSQKPLQVWSVSQTYDGNKKITVYTGPVHIEKGTLVINADRLEIVETANGNKISTLFGNAGKLVHYRQKRDGGPNLWAEGEAEKIVYDDVLDIIKLFNHAKLTLLDGKKITHESSGTYISYDSRTDFMSVNNTLQGVSVPGAGFTNAIIYPTEQQPTSKPPVESKKNSAKSNTQDLRKIDPARRTDADSTVVRQGGATPLERFGVSPETDTTKKDNQ